jgi:hypothetical protein
MTTASPAGESSATTIENPCVPVHWWASVAVTLKLNVPCPVGSPLRAPFEPRLTPGGGFPVASANV